jgi:hypothetical protein
VEAYLWRDWIAYLIIVEEGVRVSRISRDIKVSVVVFVDNSVVVDGIINGAFVVIANGDIVTSGIEGRRGSTAVVSGRDAGGSRVGNFSQASLDVQTEKDEDCQEKLEGKHCKDESGG